MFSNCHCPDCRKMTGSTLSSVLVTESEGFKVVGEGNLACHPWQPPPAGTPDCPWRHHPGQRAFLSLHPIIGTINLKSYDALESH
jgi:hypothetical protein